MQDYYSILGLDRGASQESIKVAYRRLARKFHPDRLIDSNEADRDAQSAHMAQLNEAYGVLSDPKRRREYDNNLRTLGILQSSTVSSASQPAAKMNTPSVARTSTRTQVRQPRGGDSGVVREFSKQLRANLLAKRDGLNWQEITPEGFDWGLEATSWSSHYCMASRGFALLEPAAAKKFANYSEIVIVKYNRSVRKSHFLFLLPFQQLSEWESVSALLQGVVAGKNHDKISSAPVGIVLVDMRQGRTLKLGGLPKKEPFPQILQAMGTGGT